MLNSYNQYEYNPTDFQKIYQDDLPLKSVKKKRPYTLSTTLKEANHTLMGKILGYILTKMAAKEAKKTTDPAMREVIKKSLLETPIRMLALFSNQKITLYQALGIVDLLNLRIFKGIRKITKK